MTLPWDADLKSAMLEITGILEKYQIGGNITLVSKTHSEFYYHLPDWSAVKFEDRENGKAGIRIRSKRKDFKSKEEQDKILAASIHLIAQIRDLSARSFGIFNEIMEEKLAKVIDFEHKSFHNLTPHSTTVN